MTKQLNWSAHTTHLLNQLLTGSTKCRSLFYQSCSTIIQFIGKLKISLLYSLLRNHPSIYANKVLVFSKVTLTKKTNEKPLLTHSSLFKPSKFFTIEQLHYFRTLQLSHVNFYHNTLQCSSFYTRQSVILHVHFVVEWIAKSS